MWQLFNEDCLEGMKKIPDNSIDMILTDPPYGINYVSNMRKKDDPVRKKIANDDGDIEFIQAVCKEMKRVLKFGGVGYVFYAGGGPKVQGAINWLTQLNLHFEIKNQLVWDKMSIGLGWQYRYQYEMCCYFINGKKSAVWNGGRAQSNIIKVKRVPSLKMIHPTEKPEDLLRLFIENSSNPGDTILDPFAGSGKTLVAAEVRNRDSIGFEIEKQYCDKIKDTMDNLE